MADSEQPLQPEDHDNTDYACWNKIVYFNYDKPLKIVYFNYDKPMSGESEVAHRFEYYQS